MHTIISPGRLALLDYEPPDPNDEYLWALGYLGDNLALFCSATLRGVTLERRAISLQSLT